MLSQHFWFECYSLYKHLSKKKYFPLAKVISEYTIPILLRFILNNCKKFILFSLLSILFIIFISTLFNSLVLLLFIMFSNFSIYFEFVHHRLIFHIRPYKYFLLDLLLLSLYILIKVPLKISMFSSIYFFAISSLLTVFSNSSLLTYISFCLQYSSYCLGILFIFFLGCYLSSLSNLSQSCSMDFIVLRNNQFEC